MVTLQDETRRVFQLFVEKANEFAALRFTKWVEENEQVAVRASRQGEAPIVVEIIAPDKEATYAFAFLFRLFIQNNDRLSLHNMTKRVNGEAGLPADWTCQWMLIRDQMNTYLDDPLEMWLIVPGIQPTRREVMEAFLYGELAHTSIKHEQTLQQWKSIPMLYENFNTDFLVVMWTIVGGIRQLAQLVEDLLKNP